MYGVNWNGVHQLEVRKWHATSNGSSGLDHYWEVDEDILTSTTIMKSMRIFNYRTKLIVKTASNVRPPEVCMVHASLVPIDGDIGAFKIAVIKEFCRKHPGIAVIVGGPGARDPHPDLAKFHRHDVSCNIVDASEYDCVPAAAINVLGVLFGRVGFDVARTTFSACKIHFGKLGQVGPVILPTR